MADLKLPDVSEEDKIAIADVEAELKDMYAKELETGQPVSREIKLALNEKHRAAVAAGFENRQKLIDANPELKSLQTKLGQGVEGIVGSNE